MRWPRRRAPRVDPEVRDWVLTPSRLLWLTASLAVVLGPHILRVPWWTTLIFLGLASWRLGSELRGLRPPSRWVIVVVTLIALLGVRLEYGTLLGRNAGVALLVVLSGMKLTETRALRDAYVVAYLGCFLAVTAFLFSQSIPTGAYVLGSVVIQIGAFAALAGTPDAAAPRRRLRLAATLMLQALPLMLILFFVFPRLPGPLWGLPRDAHAGSTGLGDTMSPGNISQLSRSNAVAFRVEFDEALPPVSRLYFRGPVLWHTDGTTWRMDQRVVGRHRFPLELEADPVDYTVTLEPHQHRWLFALDAPALVPPGAMMTREIQLRTPRPVRERMRYRMRSYLTYTAPELTVTQRRKGLRLPPGRHPRALALARAWRESGADDARVVERALAMFREQPFVYTLTPPLLLEDPVDQFLFDSRRGFCEHYASAFTVLMRAAGVPTRIVTGYQGGDLNTLGGYLIVRQRDAHAWTEVWLEDRGWTRVDPTAAVAPSRVEMGMDATIAPTIGAAGLRIDPGDRVARAWRRLRHGWDTVNARWNEWVLGYGPARQRDFLSWFGLDARRYGELVIALTVALGVLFAGLALVLARTTRRTADPAARAYARFCTRLRRAGVVRRPAEGPRDFARRASRERPEAADAIEAITDLYIASRYAGRTDTRELARAVAAFRPLAGKA